MGFWDKLGETLGSLLSKTVNDFNNAANKASEISSDKKLYDRYKSETNSAKKAAYANELKNRGYGKKE